ncbi:MULTISPECIES: D-xylose 1-dehydrogenase Gfo6 [Halorussus]|uniref:D-xylose 1-dehydrogenase Gfo6 n=1 Tax=Halorussus TaxID=1070314 RepID=UPI000E218ECE|nr:MULTISPECIES: D-xylose 1-dehydrogenase Gfo6 [Halorussus]NHN60287.1 Gfo/Idh/MocA family oxidoreductase [Halorussus sp. JP-T4]
MTQSLLDWNPRDWQTTTDGTLRFALVGVGWWTREFVLPAVESSDLCETTAVVSSSSEKVERVREEYDTVERGLTYEEFVDGEATDAYDAAYVCTPNATHLEYAEAAADHGKDVLCEKPMEATVERAEDLVAACDEAGVTLMVAYRMHIEPTVRRARQLVRDGVVGEPRLVHGENSQPLLEMIEDPDQWRLNPDLAGYGASVMDLGIYPLNTARFVIDADPVAVQSMMRSDHEAFDEVPDELASFTVEFDDGTFASCTSSQNAHDHTRLEIVGTEGRIELEPAFHMETGLTVETDGTTVEVDAEQVDQMEVEFDYFADRVLSGTDVYADGEHGLVDMRTIRAIHEAAETGETVEVSE